MELKQEILTFVNEFECNTAGNDGFKKDMTNSADDTSMTEKEDKFGHPDDLDQNTKDTDGPLASEATSAFNTDGLSDDEDSNVPLSHELQQGLRILKELMADSNKSVNWHFMDPVDSSHPETVDYYDRIKNPVWFRKMKEKFDSKEYESITEFVADFRLMLENCYRYNGPDHYVSKRGQKLETMMEQKLALLSRELREKTSITATSGQQFEDNSGFGLRRRTRTIIPHDSSVLLNQLREEELQREREARKLQMSERKAAQEAALQDIMDWEDNIMGGKKIEMKAMWEIPQIGHFLFLCQEQLNVGEITQFELERCFYMPRESSTMQKVMTTLLSTPFQRLKIDKKTMMPYKVWDEKLRIKLRHWYKVFADGLEDANKAGDKLGLDPHFYSVVGRKNPLEKRKFHEINVYRRVWIVKSLCDYCLEHQDSVREAIENQPIEEQHDYLVGVDAEGNRYLHFPQFCGADLRIYKQKKIPEPKLLVTHSPTKVESPKLKLKDTKLEPTKEELKKEKSKSVKKKKRKPDIPLPPTNRPSRLRQKIKTVIPVQTYSSSDEDDVDDDGDVDSDSSTETYSEDQGDMNLNDSGICEESPKKKPKNKNIGQLIENDNQSDTSSMDGEGSWKRKPTSRLVRNGLMRELKNVSEISMDESSVDKDETLSEKSFALDTDSCNIDDSNLGSNNPKESGYDDKETISFSKCVKDLDKNVDSMDVDSDDDDTSEKTKEFFKGLANTNIEREMSPYENDIDYDSPCTEGFEANDIEMNSLFNDVKASEELSNDSLADRVIKKDGVSIKLELDECNNKSNSTGDKICDKDKNESMLDNFDTNSQAAKKNNEMEVEIKFESDKFTCEMELGKKVNKTIKQESMDSGNVVSHISKSDDVFCVNADDDTGAALACRTVVKMEPTSDLGKEDYSQKATGVSGDKIDFSIKQEKLQSSGASHDHDYGLEIKNETAQKKLDHDYGQGCYADIGEGDTKETVEKTNIKQEEEEEEEEEEIAPDLTEFELIVESVEDLRNLVESFAEQEPIVIGKGKKQKIIKPPPRKKCVAELHGRLLFLLKELEPWEQKLVSATKKARLKLRKEHISYEEDMSQESNWELEKEKESSSSESEEENSDSCESDEEKSMTTNYINMAEDEPVVKTELQEDNLEFDVSSRGRIRKRRVIPNNSEDQGSAKKKKPNPVTSSSPVVPHVPAILQRQGKVVLPSNVLASSQASLASQILLQTSSGNQIQLAGQGSSQSAANVRLLTGNTLVQPQQWASLLQKTAQQSQVRSPMSVKQASHPVIQQLLSTRQPAPSNLSPKLSTYQPGTASSAGLKLPKGNTVVGSQKPGNTQQTTTIQLSNTTQPGKVQYYAANINSLPPAVVQQLVKSNALKFPAGGNQSGMVLLTTVNPQGCQGAVVQGKSDSIGVRSKIQPQSNMLRLPIATAGSRIRLPQAQAAHLQQQVSTVIPSLEIEENTLQPATTTVSVPSTNVLSGFNVALSPLLNKNSSAVAGSNISVNISNPKIDNVMVTTSLPDTIATINTKVSTAVVNTTSPNKVSQKYANNVTVKTLLESRKPPASTVSVTNSAIASVSATSTSVAEKPRVTSVLHNTPKGIKAVKIPCQAVLDLAVKTVVTSVKTSLPTANIKVPSPTTMPSLTPRRNVTKTIQSMKAPIPTTPTVESISASSSSSVVTQTISPSVSTVSMTSTPSLTTVIPNQNILAQLQSGNGGQIILTNVNKSVLGNVASQQDQAQKTSMLKFLPQNMPSSQGVVQGYLTPQGLIIPQTALQQQQTSVSPQLLSQQGVQNPVLQQYNLASPKPTSTSQISTIGGSQFVMPPPVLPQGTVAGANSVAHVGQKYVLGNFGANDSSKTVVSWVNSNNQSSLIGRNTFVTGTVPTTEGIGTNVKAFSTVNASVNTQSLLGTDTLSTGTNSQVKMSVASLSELSTVKETVGNVSKLGNPAVSSYYVPTLNMVNVDNKGNPVSLAVAAPSTVVSKPLAAPVAAYGGQLYPIVTVAGAPMTNLGTSVSGSLTPVSPTNPLVPHPPSINIPPSPVQLTSPLLGQLTNPVANVGNIATVLGQLTAPLSKSTILGQQGGNIQLLGQQAGAVGANTAQILGLQTQVNIPISSTSNVIGQQLNVAGASASQIIGQPLTSPVPKQAPSLVLGNIGQGSSSDLMKQLAAAQLLGSSQLHLTGLQAGSSSVTPSLSSTVVSGQQQQSSNSGTKPVQNQILLQIPTSPTGQSVVRPQQAQAGQAMLVLSPPKRMLSGNAGSGPTPSKQLSLRLNAPTVTSGQQLAGTLAVNAAAKKLQPVIQTVADVGLPKVPFSATKQLKTTAPLQLPKNTPPFRGEASVPTVKGFQATVTKPGTVIPKTTVSFAEGQNIASLKTVQTSHNKTEVTTNTGEKTSQKLFLYNINGQLFTPQGVPVTVENGVLKVLPQSKSVAVENGMLKVLPQAKSVQATSMLAQPATSEASDPPVSIVKSPVSLIPPHVLTNQQQKRVLISPKFLQSGESQPQAYLLATNAGLVTTKLPSGSVQTSLASVAKTVDSTQAISGIKASGSTDCPSAQGQTTGSKASTKPESADLNQKGQIDVNVTNPSQVLAGGSLNMNPVIAQHSPIAQQLTTSLNSPSASSDKQNMSLQAKVTNQSSGLTVPTGATGQGYIVMPNTAGQTQIIFPQANLNAAAISNAVKAAATSNVLGNASTILSNVKLVKAADMVKTLTKSSASTAGGDATSNVVHSPHTSKTGDGEALKMTPQGGSGKTAVIMEKSNEMKTSSKTPFSNFVISNNGKVVKYSTDMPVASQSMHSNQRMVKQKSCADGHSVAVISASHDIPNGLQNNTQNSTVPYQKSKEGIKPTPATENGHVPQASDVSEPKGAEKEEAALNLLSLANQAF